ncbi:MAG: adenosylcobinamide-phosphate synthase CbiB [Bacillota bacterium]
MTEIIMQILLLSTIAVVVGYVIDMIIGDPHFLVHPVVLMGAVISACEKVFRKVFPKTKAGEHFGGFLTVVVTIILSGGVSLGILWVAYKISPWLYLGLESLMCWQILATKSLKVESMKVFTALENGNLAEGRKYLSYIVGRDTENLDEAGIVKAAVETVAENTADGVIAPMLAILIGGAPLGFIYKAVNTCDSMIGYKNEKYKHFGTFGARLDDFCNFLPSRLSALLLVDSAWLCKYNWKNALKIWKRDRRNHHSPNSAQTESAVAGALEICLAGDAVYGGVLKKKPTIGDEIRKIEIADIKRANKLMQVASVWCLFWVVAIKLAILFIL